MRTTAVLEFMARDFPQAFPPTVIPETTARYGADYTLAPGDRLFPGEGPALTWADWPGFVPAAVEGAALVQYVLPMRLRGKPHHVEAGAWWNGSGTGVRSLTR